MEKLPIELGILIVKELPTRDICRLQQTCRAFYDLIEDDSVLWRERLQRQCGADVLWSSFFTTSELRRACTGTLRFKHRYRRGGHPTPPIARLLPHKDEGDQLQNDLNQGEGFSLAYIEESSNFHLIPGGRFLITVDKRWLRVWDLGPPGSLNEPCEVVLHEIDCVDTQPIIVDVAVADTDRVHLLIREDHSVRRLPQPFDQSEYNLNGLSRVRIFRRFQIRLPDKGQHSVEGLGRLCVLHSFNGIYDRCAAQHGPVVALGFGKTLLLWDTSDSPDKNWVASATRTEGVVFFHQGYVFAVDVDHLRVFNLTGITHCSVGKGVVDIQDGTPDLGYIPTPQIWTYQRPFTGGIFRPWASDFMLHKPVADNGPLFYDIRNTPPADETLEHMPLPSYIRLRFCFRPDNPSAGSLLRTKRYLTATQPCDIPQLRFPLDDGVAGYIWYDSLDYQHRAQFGDRHLERGGIFVSILDDPDSPEPSILEDDPDFPEPAGSVVEGLGDFSEMIARPNNETRVQRVSMCPLSGRVIVLWNRESKDDRFVEIFDLYDSLPASEFQPRAREGPRSVKIDLFIILIGVIVYIVLAHLSLLPAPPSTGAGSGSSGRSTSPSYKSRNSTASTLTGDCEAAEVTWCCSLLEFEGGQSRAGRRSCAVSDDALPLLAVDA
ncbi:hypothetical protein D9611_001163 [Ephemerocybe angulata]|uniref:F-box domain-containing protein n=1 Tax=Ephemerocybe angulata TaxID=980116 RepID=A0A8H5CIE5_9AGAR|nr:hypothetical protein D9611_001163 [Tulosesus angulatus]